MARKIPAEIEKDPLVIEAESIHVKNRERLPEKCYPGRYARVLGVITTCLAGVELARRAIDHLVPGSESYSNFVEARRGIYVAQEQVRPGVQLVRRYRSPDGRYVDDPNIKDVYLDLEKVFSDTPEQRKMFSFRWVHLQHETIVAESGNEHNVAIFSYSEDSNPLQKLDLHKSGEIGIELEEDESVHQILFPEAMSDSIALGLSLALGKEIPMPAALTPEQS